MNNLADKVVLVTGGANGIGKAIATQFAQAGARVVIADIDGEAGEKTAVSISQATGATVTAVRTDITDLDNVQATIAQVVGENGRLDIVVNNAGWDRFGLFMETTPNFWDRVIAINYKGLLNMTYAALPQMIEQRDGCFVNIASDAGRGGSMGESVYAGCKAAVIAFSKTIAREHARDNIRVNVVAPGITDTAIFNSFNDTTLGGKVASAMVKSVPLGRRAADPSEIAPAIVFLASDAASYITGQVLSVSGGLTMVD
ncbi:MAG: glucose 1-dehydrogenase [Chloroflexota bacterium]